MYGGASANLEWSPNPAWSPCIVADFRNVGALHAVDEQKVVRKQALDCPEWQMQISTCIVRATLCLRAHRLTDADARYPGTARGSCHPRMAESLTGRAKPS